MKKNRFLRLILLALFLCAAFDISASTVCAAETTEKISYTDKEEEYIKSHSPVRVGFVQDRIPVSFSNEKGELAGISRYIFDRIAKISGLKFEYVPLPAGSITFTSEKGVGSCFTFTFTARETTEPSKDIAEAVSGDGEKPHILIAEDNELNAEIMIDLLESHGFPVTLAKDGREALRVFKDSAPYTYEVILMDIMMPELDGYQATAAIRDLDREDAGTVYIIACTANSFSQEYERAIKSGMNDFISKPVDLEGLLKKIPPSGRKQN